MLNANIRRCAHIKTNGTQCGAPAARANELCHFHWRAAKDFPKRRVFKPTPIPEMCIDLATLDDPDGIHYAIWQVIQGTLNGQLSDKQSSKVLWALQLMSSNFKQTTFKRMQDDEYNSSQLNVWELWDKIKQEREDKQRTELHQKRIEEIKKLERTCCKCRHEIPAPELPPSQPPATSTAGNSPAVARPCSAGTLPAVPAGTLPADPATTTTAYKTHTVDTIHAAEVFDRPITQSPDHPINSVILNEAQRSEGPMLSPRTTTVPNSTNTVATIHATDGAFAQRRVRSTSNHPTTPSPRFSDFAILRFRDSHQSVIKANSFRSSVVQRRGGRGVPTAKSEVLGAPHLPGVGRCGSDRSF